MTSKKPSTLKFNLPFYPQGNPCNFMNSFFRTIQPPEDQYLPGVLAVLADGGARSSAAVLVRAVFRTQSWSDGSRSDGAQDCRKHGN